MLELVFTAVVMYLTGSLAMYFYLVVKTFELTEFWTFKINATHVGVFTYPRWLLGWLHWVVVKAHEFKR